MDFMTWGDVLKIMALGGYGFIVLPAICYWSARAMTWGVAQELMRSENTKSLPGDHTAG